MTPAVRELDVGAITEAVAALCVAASCELPDDVSAALRAARQAEESSAGREVLAQLLENADIAAARQVPICQDTGFAVVFAEVGQDVHLRGGGFADAVDEGVRRGYRDGYLRKSVVAEPAHARRNTGDNTPAILHISIVPGSAVRLTLMAKGGGAENMSSLTMLTPSQGWDGVAQTVVDTVSRAGSNPCPPVIVGVGLGGTIEMVTLLAKKALLREIGSRHRGRAPRGPRGRAARGRELPRHRPAGPWRQDHRPGGLHRGDALPYRQSAGGRQHAVPCATAQDRGALREAAGWLRAITTPLSAEAVKALRAGDHVRISGVLYQARDAAHKRLAALIETGEPLPFDLRGAIIYYMGPSPTRPGAGDRLGRAHDQRPHGCVHAAAPGLGLRGMIGKGARSQAVKDALREHTAVYFAATGGAGALLATHVVATR